MMNNQNIIIMTNLQVCQIVIQPVVCHLHVKKATEAQKRAPKKYYEKNKQDINNKQMQYYNTNKENIRMNQKVYYEKNKENIQKNIKNYYEKNKEHIIKYNVDILMHKYNTDPNYRQQRKNYQLNYYYTNKLLMQEQKEHMNILSV